MSYELSNGIPIPPAIPGRKPSAETIAMRTMEIGQSFLIEDHDRWQFARAKLSGLRPKRYSIRKVEGGWRVWRVE